MEFNFYLQEAHQLLKLFSHSPHCFSSARPPEGRKERPTLHYSVERHLILNAINTSLIWAYPQVVMSSVESVVFIANAHRVYVYSTLQQLRVQAGVRCCASSSLQGDVAYVVACRFRSLSISLHPVNRVTISIASAVRVRTCTYSIA